MGGARGSDNKGEEGKSDNKNDNKDGGGVTGETNDDTSKGNAKGGSNRNGSSSAFLSDYPQPRITHDGVQCWLAYVHSSFNVGVGLDRSSLTCNGGGGSAAGMASSSE